jgi:hypothetical protein
MDWSKFLTRKFVAATGTAVLMTASWILSNWLHQAASSFGTLVTGLGGALAAYTAGNVAQDHVLTRNKPEDPTKPA